MIRGLAALLLAACATTREAAMPDRCADAEARCEDPQKVLLCIGDAERHCTMCRCVGPGEKDELWRRSQYEAPRTSSWQDTGVRHFPASSP